MERKTSVNLREKRIKDKRLSLYLDFYPPIISPKTGKKTRRQFLGIYVKENPKNKTERDYKKEKMREARAYRAEIELQVINGTYGKQKVEDTNIDFIEYFENFVESYKHKKENTYNCIKSALLRFRHFCNGELKSDEVTKQLVEKYRAYLEEAKDFRTGKPLSHNSKSIYFTKFRSVVLKAYHDGILEKNPIANVRGIRLKETKRNFLTLGELTKLLNTPVPFKDDDFINICRTLVYTGLRLSDIKKLKWAEVEYSESLQYHIKFQQKKTSDNTTLTIPNHIYQLFGERKGNNELVFGTMQSKITFNRKLKKWTTAAGIEKHITAHCLRHTFATLQLANNTDFFTVSKLLGHKNIRTTQIYAHIMDEAKVKAANAIPVI